VDAGELFAEAASVQFYDWPHPDVVAVAIRAGKTVYGHTPGGYSQHAIVDEPDDEIFRRFPVAGGGYLISTPIDGAPLVDLVITYRPPEEQPGILDMARQQGAKSFWIQPPAETSAEARDAAAVAGVVLVEGVDLRDLNP
jgi:hypothetical protein